MIEKKIKICGMTDARNIAEACLLWPDYMGFILYKRSPRYVSLEKAVDLVKEVPPSIQKTGVIVNEPFEHAIYIAKSGIFDILQLHGDENPEFCRKLSVHIPVIKAFRIAKELPGNLKDYQPFCSIFLFDSDGKDFGGSGKKFDHDNLNGYKLNTSYILSGGISVDDSKSLRSFAYPGMAGVDLNSRFEVSPGIKDIGLLRKFIENLRTDDDND
jgi:phosphoribosylanthranilate isomerase